MNTVAIQGTIGSYSEEAAVALLGKGASIRGYRSFFETFQALLLEKAEYAVIPVFNSIAGEISIATKFLSQSNLTVLDELPLAIRHVLVGNKETEIDVIRIVRSHVEALKQCSEFFAENPNITQTVGADTASCIRRVTSEGNPQNASIGSARAAKIYGGRILCENISNKTNNQTTFHLVGK